MIKIAVVEDEVETARQIEETIRTFFQSRKELAEVFCCTSSMELLFEIDNSGFFDLYFLDVVLDVMNGLDLGKHILRIHPHARIMFVTNYREYAFPAFELHPWHFIKKDNLTDGINWGLVRLCDQTDREHRNSWVLRNGSESVCIPQRCIYSVEKEDKNIIVTYAGGTGKKRCTIKKVMEKLDADQFFLTDRGTVVNLCQIKCIRERDVVLCNDMCFPLSRAKRKELKEKMMKLWHAF